MFTIEQLHEIDERLRKGDTPEVIASAFGMSHSKFRYTLLMSGKRWITRRELVDILPADKRQDKLAEVGG